MKKEKPDKVTLFYNQGVSHFVQVFVQLLQTTLQEKRKRKRSNPFIFRVSLHCILFHRITPYFSIFENHRLHRGVGSG